MNKTKMPAVRGNGATGERESNAVTHLTPRSPKRTPAWVISLAEARSRRSAFLNAALADESADYQAIEARAWGDRRGGAA